MKKTFLIAISALSILFITTSCESESISSMQTTQEIPLEIDTFIRENFPDNPKPVLDIFTTKHSPEVTYYATLPDGIVITFNKDKNWTEIQGYSNEIPTKLLPEKISNYIATKYPNQIVQYISKREKEIWVGVSKASLAFNLQGELLKTIIYEH